MSEVTWPDVVTAIATSLIAAFALFAAFQIREARRDRHARLLNDMTERWDTLLDAREEAAKYTTTELRDLVEKVLSGKGTPEDRELYLELLTVPSYFEDLGVLVESGSLSAKVVDMAIGTDLILQYRRWHPAIVYFQTHASKTNLQWFGKLARRVAKRRKETLLPAG